MAKDTPSMAKNKMRRCLGAVLDPHPTSSEVKTLWMYFQSTCAYCGIHIDPESRTGHLDHIMPSALGGTNEIHNYLLACSRCNGDEKRDEDWQSFLERKIADRALVDARRSHILAWVGKANGRVIRDPAVIAEADAIIFQALEEFDIAVKKLRALRGGNSKLSIPEL